MPDEIIHILVQDPNEITEILVLDTEESISIAITDREANNNGWEFTQSSPLNQWTINHNLGFRPSVEIFDVGGSEIEGHVMHLSSNQTIIQFETPISGKARLN